MERERKIDKKNVQKDGHGYEGRKAEEKGRGRKAEEKEEKAEGERQREKGRGRKAEERKAEREMNKKKIDVQKMMESLGSMYGNTDKKIEGWVYQEKEGWKGDVFIMVHL